MGAYNYLAWVAAALSGVFAVASLAVYLKSIWARKTHPNAITYLLWCALEILAFSAQLSGNPTPSAVLVGLSIVITGTVTYYAFTGYGYRGFDPIFDGGCAVSSVAGAILWKLSGDPALAIFFAIVADVFAGMPTLKKIWNEPDLESGTSWLLFLIAACFGIAAAGGQWDFENLAFPMYLALMNGAAFLLIFLRRKALAKNGSNHH